MFLKISNDVTFCGDGLSIGRLVEDKQGASVLLAFER